MSEPPQWVYLGSERLERTAQQMAQLLGGKGASLRRLREAGCAVPPWFTISTDACRHYFENSAWPEDLWVQVQAGVQSLESETQTSFGNARSPLLLAIRSGAAVSMPGAMDTILNCGLSSDIIAALPLEQQRAAWSDYAQFIVNFAASRNGLKLSTDSQAQDNSDPQTTCAQLQQRYTELTGEPFPQDPWICLRESVVAVWNSFYSDRAHALRKSLSSFEMIGGTAVTIQAMARVDAAGVMFTCVHQPDERGAIIIEASTESGQRLVSGEITPSRYVVLRDEHSLLEPNVANDLAANEPGEPPPLDRSQVCQLAQIGLRLERDFGEPLDIEWGLRQSEWIFFQARGIDQTVVRNVDELRRRELESLRELARTAPRVWVRHPLSETLPAPTPLTTDLMRQFMSGAGGYGRVYQQLGYEPSQDVCTNGLLQSIAGRFYVEPLRVAELFAPGWPFRYDVDQLRADSTALERAPTLLDEQRIDETFLLRLPRLLWIMFRARRRTAQLRQLVRDRFEQQVLPSMRDYVRRERQRDLASLEVVNLIKVYADRRRAVLDEFAPESLLPGLFGGLAYAALERELVALLGDVDGRELARELVSGLESEQITQRDEMLYQVARGQLPLSVFLEEFGHRAVNELDLSVPRWREDTNSLEPLIDWLRKQDIDGPMERRESARQLRMRRAEELPDRLAAVGGTTFLPRIRDHLWRASELLPYREIGKHYFMLGYELVRQALCELARRHDWTDEIFFCREHELTLLQTTPPRSLRATLLARRRQWQLMQRIDLPDVIESNRIDELLQGVVISKDVEHSFRATVLSPGTARGRALVANELHHAVGATTGFVLICNSLDPGLTPLLTGAKGLVVQRGGTLSHGAVVARQLGVPALACPDAVAVIKSGDWLLLDGHEGMLHIERTHV